MPLAGWRGAEPLPVGDLLAAARSSMHVPFAESPIPPKQPTQLQKEKDSHPEASYCMRKSIIITAAVIVLVILLVVSIAYWSNKQPSPLVGTWMLYEGGYVAPEVLTFHADGSGIAYALSEAYQDNRMTNVQIPQSCLEQAESFRWRAENGMLTFSYENGKQNSLKMSFDTTFDVRILSLDEGFGGGGWITAKIID